MGMGKLAETAPAFNALARTLKAAVDPHGTLAPGKYGI
jgi:FAD/FMN-containing dehydrogenase